MLVHSIFESISGEAGFFLQGTWCTFIRLQGCNLKCDYCDTPAAQELKNPLAMEMSIDEIIAVCNTHQILITGGEPLAQKNVMDLIGKLDLCEYSVQVETNGSILLPKYRPNAYWIIDRKGPCSRVQHKMVNDQDWSISTIIVKYIVSDNRFEEDISFVIKDIWFLIGKGYKGKFIVSAIDAEKGVMKKCIESLSKQLVSRMDQIVFSLQIHKIVDLA